MIKIFIFLNNINQEYYIEQGEVLFNNTNSQELVGKTAIFNMNGQYVCSNHITRIKVNKEYILPEYLTIILNIYQERKVFFNTCINWNNQSGINTEMLKQYKIPVPKINIQQNIIDIMNNAYKLKKEKEGEAKRLLDSIDGYLLDELGIKVPAQDTTLKNRIFTRKFSELSGDRFDCSYNQEYYKELDRALKQGKYTIDNIGNLIEINQNLEDMQKFTEIAYIELSSIDKNNGIIQKVKNIKNNFPSRARQKVAQGDLLVSNLSGSMQAIAMVDNLQKDNLIASTGFFVIKSSGYNAFLMHLLRTNLFQVILEKETSGAIMPSINIDKFLNLKIPVPPAEIQEKISNEILSRKAKALKLQNEARKFLEEAKYRVENIIFGERV